MVKKRKPRVCSQVPCIEGTENIARQTLNAAAQNVAKAAEILGIERTNLHKKIKKYESNSFDTDESED